jgi:hypothetical protein
MRDVPKVSLRFMESGCLRSPQEEFSPWWSACCGWVWLAVKNLDGQAQKDLSQFSSTQGTQDLASTWRQMRTLSGNSVSSRVCDDSVHMYSEAVLSKCE